MRLRSRLRRIAWLAALVSIVALATGCGLTRSPAPKSTLTDIVGPTGLSTGAPAGPVTTAGGTSPPATRTSPKTRPAKYPGCHTEGDPRAGVNTPLRLLVRDPCIRVRGIAGCIFTDKGDGDTHIALLLNAADAAKYLTPGNASWTCDSDQGSNTAPRLVIEVIPQHCVVRPDNCADRGHFTDPPIPKNGQHVTITGPWVQDTSTKQGRTLWSEIHPAWRITVDDNDDDGVPAQGTGVLEEDPDDSDGG
jgi:hypothetical protein